MSVWPLAISFFLTAGSAAELPSDAQLTQFLDMVRQDMAGIHNCTCLETIERARRRPPSNEFRPVDTIRLEVSTVAGKEVFANPGRRFEDGAMESLVSAGTVGSGVARIPGDRRAARTRDGSAG